MRLLLLALILANSLYFAWSQRYLESLGFAPQDPTEPQRVAQQIAPEAVRILGAAELKLLEAKPATESSARECLQAGPFDAAQASALRSALESGLPAGSWELPASTTAARWTVYMGKFVNAEALNRKRAEITAMNLKTEPLVNPALEPGLSLGGFETKPAADAFLEQLGRRGVHTARVVQEREESQVFQLRLAAVTADMKTRLDALKPALGGKSLKSCG